MPTVISQGVSDRFWAKVNKAGKCWLWTASTDSHGYGKMRIGTKPGRLHQAHRISWEITNGEIPAGHFIDHQCFTTLCVNPDHLRPATNKQNLENRAGAQANSKSGVRGVNWHKAAGKWRAGVKHNMTHYYIGLFVNLADAEAAVTAKRNELFTHNDSDRRPA